MARANDMLASAITPTEAATMNVFICLLLILTGAQMHEQAVRRVTLIH